MGFFVFWEKYEQAICRNISKIVSGKYSLRHLDLGNKCVTDELKYSAERAIQKAAEATSDLIGFKIANKITNVLITSPQISSETIESETRNVVFDRKTPKEKYMSRKRKLLIIKNIIDDLRCNIM